MDTFTNAMLSPDEDTGMDASFLSQSTVREEGPYNGMPSYSMTEAGMHYAVSRIVGLHDVTFLHLCLQPMLYNG
jgi:hypothetical protein